MRKFLLCGLLGLAVAGAISPAADSYSPARLFPREPAKKPGSFVFLLWPKAFQSRPLLDFNVITEMTPEGKLLRLPSPEQPVYYVEYAGPIVQAGSWGESKYVPSVADLEKAMKKALSVNGYLPETPEHRATLVVVFSYGSHENRAPADASSDLVLPTTAEEWLPFIVNDRLMQKDLMDRAGLVGGSRFVQELAKAFEREVANVRSNYDARAYVAPVSPDRASPFQMFLAANPQLLGIIEDAFTGCYFVVASAYDYAAMSQERKVLYWRTKMTVNSAGISMKESLEPLIASAGPYFGRPMAGPETVSRRISREGRVDVGVPRVVERDIMLEDAGKPAEKP